LVEFGGGALRLFGGGVVAEVLLGCGDERFEAGDFLLDVGDAVFELLELDGVEALDGGFRLRGELWRFGGNAGVLRSAQDDTSINR
jgi:hypothetical protein